MTRIFLLLLIGLGLYLVFRSIRGAKAKTDDQTPTVEKMVQCARCGVHLPESESVQDGDLHYCSVAHRSENDGDDARK